MRRSTPLAGLMGLALASGLLAQGQNVVRDQNGPGPNGTGFFTQELPAGFRIQGINPPSWRVPGTSNSGALPKGQIFRTPLSAKLAARLEAQKQARISRNDEHRARLLSRNNDTHQGAGWKYLQERRSRQEGARITPQGVIPGEMAVRPRQATPGLHIPPHEEAAPQLPATVSEAAQDRQQYLAQWQQERAERQRLQQEVLSRVIANQSRKASQQATAERQANRRYGLSGGTVTAH